MGTVYINSLSEEHYMLKYVDDKDLLAILLPLSEPNVHISHKH